MRIDILSAVPKLLESPFNDSILQRAKDKKIVDIHIHNIRDYSKNKQKSIDDYAFGGGAGMVLTIEPIDLCITMLKKQRDYDEIIFMTPDGDTLSQTTCNQLSTLKNPNCLQSIFDMLLSILDLVTHISSQKNRNFQALSRHFGQNIHQLSKKIL